MKSNKVRQLIMDMRTANGLCTSMYGFQGLPQDKDSDYSLTKISSYLHHVSTQSTSDRPAGNAFLSPIPGSIQKEKNVTDSEVARIHLVDTMTRCCTTSLYVLHGTLQDMAPLTCVYSTNN